MSGFTLAILKAIGVILTGVFGIIGAATNFKTQEGKLTKWGRRNLIALVCALLLAVVAQAVEYIRAADQAESAATQAAKAAEKLEAIVQNLDRVSDPLGPVRIEFDVDFPSGGGPDATGADLTAFLTRLEAIRTSPHANDGEPIVLLCQRCEGFPNQKKEPAAHSFITSRLELAIFFFRPMADFTLPDPHKAEPNMSLLAGGAPDPAGLSPPTYNQSTKLFYLGPPPQRVSLEDNYYDDKMRSVRDLVGARMAVEIRSYSDAISEAMLKKASLRFLSLSFPGRRELSFAAKDFKKESPPNRPTLFVYDFPNTWEALKARFVP